MNCLPGAGWEPVSKAARPLPTPTAPGRDIVVNRYVVQKGLDRQLVLYWYHGRGRVVASEYWSKLFLINDAVRSNRTDGALVRVIAPIPVGAEDDGAAGGTACGRIRSRTVPASSCVSPRLIHGRTLW